MPLSEFHQTRTKNETPQSKMNNYTSDLSLVMADQDFVELLWENGPIVMQGQSSRAKKSTFTPLSPHTNKFQGKGSKDAVIPKIGHYGEMDSSEFAPSVPSAPFGLNAQGDDASPWMDYRIDDSLENDYCSDFLSEFTGAHLTSQSINNSTVATDRSNGFSHTARESHDASKPPNEAPELRVRTSQLFQLAQHCHSPVLSTKQRVTESCNAGKCSSPKGPSGNFMERSSLKVDLGASKPPPVQSSGLGLVNFSHFSRPVARVRSNFETVDRLRSHEKGATAASSTPMESSLINSASGVKSQSVAQGQPTVRTKMELMSSGKAPPELVFVGESAATHRGETSRDKYTNNVADGQVSDPANCHSSNVMASAALIRAEADKGHEVAVASSSVCSVNSVDEESNDPKQTIKRKNREGEELGYHSEDLEDESVGLKKPSNSRTMNAKRSRAAEVHNLSERRRRDRINEKMRALQELIPNCNKVDKASMLDEAIEYLKTLQLQVQIMSMGNGLCMPPIMLPPGMPHLHPPPMTHFSPMGLNMGMGMGMGYGMGGFDMNASPGCPIMPVPPMHGPQFSCHSMPAARPVAHGLPGMPGSTSFQMYGIPGQRLPVSMSHAPAYASVPGLSPKVNLMPQLSVALTTPVSIVNAAPPSNSKDQKQRSI